MKRLAIPLLFGLLISSLPAHAGAALLVEEPYGKFGNGVPMGHAAIYLPQVCAITPTQLRRCNEGELGVVISRYLRIGGRDWLAIPLIPYLYAVDRIEDVPDYVNPEMVRSLRDEYRRAHLQEIAPDPPNGGTPGGYWAQLIGASYDRKIYMYHFETTPEQDDRLIATLNSDQNKPHFNFFSSNCADFSHRIINLYYPGATGRSIIADLGITTPKQLARSLRHYSRRHENLDLTTVLIKQVPGSGERSHSPHGVLQALLTSKKYAIPLAPLALVHPFFAAGVVATYLFSERSGSAKPSEVLTNPEQVSVLAKRYSQPNESLMSSERKAKMMDQEEGFDFLGGQER